MSNLADFQRFSSCQPSNERSIRTEDMCHLEEVRVLLPGLGGEHGPLLLAVVLVDVLARRHLHHVVRQLPRRAGDLALRPRRAGSLLGRHAKDLQVSGYDKLFQNSLISQNSQIVHFRKRCLCLSSGRFIVKPKSML